MNFPSQRQAAQLMPARVVRGFDRPTWIGIAAAAAGIALLAVVALRRQKAGRLAIALLGGILMLDLLMVSLGQATYDPHTGMLVGRPPEVRWLDQHLGSQRFGLHTLVNAAPGPYDQLEDCRAMLFGLSNAGGMPCGNATYPGRDVFCIAAHCIPPVTALAGIKYVLYSPVIGKLTDPAYLEVAHDERYTFYEYQHEAPLAFFVGQLQSVPDSKTALNMLCNGQADPKTVALLEGPLPDPAPQPAAAPARVVSTKRLPGRWHIGTDTGAPAQLVISEGYAPGWRCRVDDRPVNVFRTDAEILSVPVPAGRHTVVLWYSPPEFWYGLALTGLGILIAAAILAGPRLRLDRLWRRSQAPG
jgi:hypothetical protein